MRSRSMKISGLCEPFIYQIDNENSLKLINFDTNEVVGF